jgi:trigger factor
MAQEKKTIDFKSDVAGRKSCSITINVEVAKNIVAGEIESVFNQIQQQTRLDGFRHGKVPISIIKQKFAKEAKNRVVENIIKKTVFNALAKESFNSIDSPVVEEFDYELGQDLKYCFTSECHPAIDVKDYKDISITKEVFKVTDKNLEQSLNALRKLNARLVPSKLEKATDKSFVLIDYDVFDIDGKAISQGLCQKGHMLDLSSEDTLEGFKDALIGVSIGDERDVKIDYAADYPNKTCAGKTIIFKTKVSEIKEQELPALDDDFAKDIGAIDLQDLKSKVKTDLEVKEKRRQDREVEKQIIDYLLEKNKFETPTSLVEDHKRYLIEEMKEYMQKHDIPKEYVNKQIEREDKEFKKDAEEDVRLSYILNAIYANENLTVSDSDIATQKEKTKAPNPKKEDEIDKYFADNKKDIMISLKEQKAFEFLLENAKIKVEEKDMPLKKD